MSNPDSGAYHEGLAQPPHSREAEQNVVGAILIQNDAYEQISWLAADAFYFQNHRTIWTAAQALIERGIQADIVTVWEEIQRTKQQDQSGGPEYIARLATDCIGAINIKRHAELVRQKAILRKLVQHGTEAATEALTPGADPMALAEKYESAFLSVLDSGNESEIVPIGQALAEHLEWEAAHPNGLPTGLADLDALTGGLHGGNLVVIAGRPHMGKTGLGLQCAEAICAGQPGLMFSLEAPRRDIAKRLYEWHKAKIGQERAADRIYAMNLMVSDITPLTPGLIRSKVRRLRRSHKIKTVLVDYLQLVSGTGDNREQEVAFISRQLKLIAMENEIPVIVMAQLNREVEKLADKRPNMSHLRESGGIENDADLIFLLYREDYYQRDFQGRMGDAEIIVGKNRNNGRTGNVKAMFNRETGRYENRAYSMESGLPSNVREARRVDF